MKPEFTLLSSAVLSAFQAYQRQDDLINKKHLLIKSILASHNSEPETILFLGFDPWILGDWTDTEIFVGCITNEVATFLDDQQVQYTRIWDDELYTTVPFDVVVAADEFLTYSKDEEQRELVILMSELATAIFITTMRDYKNMPIHARDFSQPTVIKNDVGFSVFQEFHNYQYKVKNAWQSYIYENGANTRQHGPFKRQPIFFKQLATFGFDAGATQFKVHKDVMFKSLLKKNFEHIVSVIFK